MARVKAQKVLDKLEYEIEYAMKEALRAVAPTAGIDHRKLTREFLRKLSNRVGWVTIPDTSVS